MGRTPLAPVQVHLTGNTERDKLCVHSWGNKSLLQRGFSVLHFLPCFILCSWLSVAVGIRGSLSVCWYTAESSEKGWDLLSDCGQNVTSSVSPVPHHYNKDYTNPKAKASWINLLQPKKNGVCATPLVVWEVTTRTETVLLNKHTGDLKWTGNQLDECNKVLFVHCFQ